MNLDLTGRRALVLGSSRGLGFAVARTFVQEGAAVILCGRDATKLDAAAASLRSGGREVDTHVIDLSDKASVARSIAMIATAEATPVDILVNNGGGPPPGPISAVSEAQWSASFETMVNALFGLTGALLPGMRQRGWGRIVNIASSGVVQPIPNLGISNAMRASVVGWAKTLAEEVAPDGVTVNTVLPGRIHTQRVDELDAAAARRTGQSIDATAEAARKAIPMRRYGEPQEFADMVVFLASGRASYITGSVVRVDGGAIRGV